MKNFFKGISFTQVLAGSLAAVTAFLLSSKIGIAGSVIGVAIGSIVSAVASQLYQNVIHASSKKIQSSSALKSVSSHYADDDTKVVNNARFIALEDDMPEEYEVHEANEPRRIKTVRKVMATASGQNADNSVDNTSIMELSSLRKMKEEDNSLSEGDSDSLLTLTDAKRRLGNNGDYDYAKQKSYVDNESRYKRLTILVAVLSALAAVIITAGMVLLFTQGKGTDNLNNLPQNPVQNNNQTNRGNQAPENSENNRIQNQNQDSGNYSKSSEDNKNDENSSDKKPSDKKDENNHEGNSLDDKNSSNSGDSKGADGLNNSGSDSKSSGSKGDSSQNTDSGSASSPSSPSYSSPNGADGGTSVQQGESGSQQSSGSGE